MNTNRPTRFEDIIGQNIAKEILMLRVQAFKKTHTSSGHMLFCGPSGLGKTTLANVYANSLGVGFQNIMAPRIKKWEDLLGIIQKIKLNDVVFIDEIHALPFKMQEELYGILEDFQYDKKKHTYEGLEIRKIDIPRFTLVAATTHDGLLKMPLRRRFQLSINLEPYTTEQLVSVIKNDACHNRGLCDFPNEIAHRIALLSKSNTATALNLFQNLVELVEATYTDQLNAGQFSIDLLYKLVKLQGLDPFIGLDRVSRQYLTSLVREGEPLGLSVLSTILNEQEETIQNVIEPFLSNNSINITVKYGVKLYGPFVKFTKSGRSASESAKTYVELCERLQKMDSGWFVGERFN